MGLGNLGVWGITVPCLILWFASRWFTSYCVFVCLFAPDLFSYYWQFEQSGSLWHLTIGEDILIPRGSQTSKILHKIARNRENFEDMGQNCNFISWNAPSRIYLLPPQPPLQFLTLLLRLNNSSIQTLCAEWYHVVHLRWHLDAISWSQSS